MNELAQRFRNLKLSRQVLIGVGLLLAAGLAIFMLMPRQARYIVAAEQSYVPSLLLSGEVVAVDSSQLSAAVSSSIQEIMVREGERVSRGELLAILDAGQAEASVAQAQASLEYSQNHLARESQDEAYESNDLENQRLQAAARLEQAGLRLEEARRQLEQEQADYQRSVQLYQAGAISQQEYEQAGLRLEGFENGAALAEKEAELARLELEALQETASDIAMLESEVRQKRAALQSSQDRLDDYYLYAPVDGQVTELFKLPGDMLSAGETLLQISSTGRTRILVQPDQRYASLIQPGTRAEVWSQADPYRRWGGRIVYVKPAWDARAGTLEAEIELDDPGSGFSPGAIVTVQLLAVNPEQAIIIPQEYLGSLNSQSGVWLYRNEELSFAPVTTAEGNQNGLIIKSGVSSGDTIVFPDNYTEGQELRLVKDASYQASL